MGSFLTRPTLRVEMTLIYSHLAPDYMAGEIARLSFDPAQRDLSHRATELCPTRGGRLRALG